MIINMEALGYPGAFCGFGRMANPDRVFFCLKPMAARILYKMSVVRLLNQTNR